MSMDSPASAQPPPLEGLGGEPFASFSEHLAPGEGVVAYSEGLIKEGGITFDKCKVVLTRYRLIIIKHGWPWGYKVDKTYPRESCSVIRHKERVDGSQLLIVHDDETNNDLCLYFGRADRDESEAIRKSLTKAAPPAG